MNRLTGAAHFLGSSTSTSLTSTERCIGYDLNGNITCLERYGASGFANDLVFSHSGNRMTSGMDYLDNTTWTNTYDALGNLVRDGRQNLEIRWNILNFTSGAETQDCSLTYARLSDGALVSSQKVSGNSTTGKRYCGSFVFSTGTGITTPLVESIAWDEGRIFHDAQTGTYRDCWFAGDHLGDVRSVVDISPNQSSPVVLEQNDYLPFGTKIANPLHAQMDANRWRYAGKEEFPEMNLLDFGARLYDPFTARWTAVDPLARKYLSTGPYAYCVGDPINLIDPNGMQWYSYTDENGNTQYVYYEGAMPDKLKEQYNNLKYVGYFFYNSDNNKYYSLFGKILDWTDSNGNPAEGQVYEKIDRLLRARATMSDDTKVSMYIPGLPLGENRNLGLNCPFVYEGRTFTTLPVLSLSGEKRYFGNVYWNTKDRTRPGLDTSLSSITDLPTNIPQENRVYTNGNKGYWLKASNFNGVRGGFQTLQLLFSRANAARFMHSYNSIFSGHPTNN